MKIEENRNDMNELRVLDAKIISVRCIFFYYNLVALKKIHAQWNFQIFTQVKLNNFDNLSF